MIWSSDPNGVIGDTKGNLVNSSPEDMKHFKQTTIGLEKNAVVMGHNTYKTLTRALENRLNIVLTNSEPKDKKEGFIFVDSISKVLRYCSAHRIHDLWVIGGANVYEQFLDLSEKLIVTHWGTYSTIEPDDTVIFNPDLDKFNRVHSVLLPDSPDTVIDYYLRKDT